MDLTIIKNRLETIPQLVNRVGVCADIGAALAAGKGAPWAWITLVNAKTSPNTTMAVITQRRTIRLSIVVHVSQLSDLDGDAALATCEVLRTDIMDKLLGFDPSYSTVQMDPLEHQGDQLAHVNGGDLYWKDDYMTSHIITSRRSV